MKYFLIYFINNFSYDFDFEIYLKLHEIILLVRYSYDKVK